MPVLSWLSRAATQREMTRNTFTGSRAPAFGMPPAEWNLKRQALRQFLE
jgi:hypothetical protein